MKISSQPQEQVYGSGEHNLRVNTEELQYIAALLYITRLGPGPYKAAAMKLLNTIEEIFDDDFVSNAAHLVDLRVSVIENDGNDTVKEQFHSSFICLEV